MFYWLTSTKCLTPLCWTPSSIVRNRGWNGPLWNSVCESGGAPAKELAWANMGLGFRRPTHRASETQILRSELESLWTYRLLCEICERVTSAVSSIRRHHAIQWGHEVACEFVKMFSDVMQYEGNFGKLDWWGLKPLSWRQEIIEAHVTLLTSLVKNSNFSDKAADDEMSNISKHSDPMWQVLHHRVTYRAVIPKIGHILSPSDHANRMAGEKPQPQFDNLKSKIGFTRPCSGLRIQTYWSNRVNNWRGQLNGENMSWIKQLALERGYLQLNGGPIHMQLNGGAGANYTSCSN